jgi:sec-independent protein translocase protein TatC
MNTKKNKKTSSHKNKEHGNNHAQDRSLPVMEHLIELRSRILLVLLMLIIGTIASFAFSDYILQAFIDRFYEIVSLPLNIFDPFEGFLLRLKISFIIALYVFFPLVIIQAWRFIKPAIDATNIFFYRMSIVLAFLLFYGGTLLSYFFIHPLFIQLVLQLAPKSMNKIINASIYLNQSIFICVSVGVLCELPVIIMILTNLGIITPQLLIKNRKYMIILCWLVAAILSPPDILTQILFAIPLMLLYEISIIISKLIILRKRKRQ